MSDYKSIPAAQPRDIELVPKKDHADDVEKSSSATLEQDDVEKSSSATLEQDDIGTLSELFMYADNWDYFLMTLGAIGGLGTGFSMPIFNVIFGQMLNALNSDPGSFSRRVNDIAIIFIYVGLGNLVSGMLQVVCWSKAGERMSQKFREAYVTSILRQEVGWFDTNGSAELTTKVADLSGKLQDGLTRKVGDLFQFFGQFIASFGVAIYLCWSLTLVLLAAFPLIGGAGAFMIKSITAAVNNVGDNYAAAGGVATEAIGAIRTVTSLNAQIEVISKYRAFLLDAMQIGIKKGLNVGLGNGMVFGAAFCTYALGFWYGGKIVADDIDRQCNPQEETCLSGGTVLSVFFAVLFGSVSLGQLVPPVSAFFTAKASVRPILKIVSRKPLIDGLSTEGLIKLEPSSGRVEFRNLEFSYPSRPNVKVCKQFSLSINPGETVALVGASGCGKSTVINLIMRFYDPESGTITLDGTDIKELNIRWLRSQIGYVGQEPVLFSGSIQDNIGYGLDKDLHPRGDQFLEKIETAAKLANAYDFIQELPLKFDTDVGSNGVALSGGQKQRIAIARALVKKPALLLLDEATSALDATSERLVQDSIDKLQQSKAQTTIVIAHRLSTIRNADKICVVEDGKIVEIGKHDDLILKGGRYADLVRLQMTSASTSEVSVETKVVTENADKSAQSLDNSVSNEVLKNDELVSNKSNHLSKVWALVMEHPFWLAIALFGGACFGAMFPLWGLMTSKTQTMFYYTDTDKMRSEALKLSMWYLALAFGSVTSSCMQYGGSSQVGERVSMKLRSAFFEAIMRREISYFDDVAHAAGALTTQLADDSRLVARATGDNVPRLIQAAFTLLVGLGLGFSANAKLAGVVLAVFPLNIIASGIQMNNFAGQQYEMFSTNAGSLISSAFINMRTVSAFSMQSTVTSDYIKLTRAESTARASRSWVAGLGLGLSQALMMWTYALLFWYGSTLIKKDEVTFEDMMTSILSLMLGALGLGQALIGLSDQKEGLPAAKRIFDAIEGATRSPCDGLSSTGLVPSSQTAGKIELKNVTFRYPSRPGVEVCKNLNLVINPGEVVALVGPSGSGKSSIVNLILRFYEPESGQILLDDVPITDINVRWLRSQIGYVGQEPVLFSGSIASNIARGLVDYNPNALVSVQEAEKHSDQLGKEGIKVTHITAEKDMDAIIEAAKSAYADEFISKFKEGYNTDVGQASIMVSGGQKQRIAIARALVKKPALLLLDEATSALDATSERLVQDSIDKLQQSKAQTTIVIAHRLSTIRNADKICVIDKGVMVQIGTHDELLRNESGLYYSLWNKQAGGNGK